MAIQPTPCFTELIAKSPVPVCFRTQPGDTALPRRERETRELFKFVVVGSPDSMQHIHR